MAGVLGTSSESQRTVRPIFPGAQEPWPAPLFLSRVSAVFSVVITPVWQPAFQAWAHGRERAIGGPLLGSLFPREPQESQQHSVSGAGEGWVSPQAVQEGSWDLRDGRSQQAEVREAAGLPRKAGTGRGRGWGGWPPLPGVLKA